MYNLLMKELKLGVPPIFYILPFLTGALMLIPGWLYFLVILYFFFISLPNIFGGYKTQNDLMFTLMLPVSKLDIVKARIGVIVILEVLHIIIAAIFGVISTRLYPNLQSYFYEPNMGFWGLCFIMVAIFNIIFIPMYYKTAYKYGAATFTATAAVLLFATGAEWLGIANSFVFDLFKGSGTENVVTQLILLVMGILIFATFNIIAYNIAIKRFEKVEA